MNFDSTIMREEIEKELTLIQKYMDDKELFQINETEEYCNLVTMILRKMIGKKYYYFEKNSDFDKLYKEFLTKLESIEFTSEEKIYLAYNRYVSNFFINRNPLWNIMLRRKLIELYGQGSMENAIKSFKENKYNFPEDIKDALELLEMKNWPNREQLKNEVNRRAEYLFNFKMNCGGYALKVETCIFGGGYYGNKSKEEYLDRNVSQLLETFPFIRLLGDTELEEDEYVVEYRADKNSGHHFIRIDQDGLIRDKNECHPPRIIEDISKQEVVWGENLSNCPYAIFAVKEEHDYHFIEHNLFLREGKNFEEFVIETLQNEKDEFSYHNHSYQIKTNAGGDIEIYSNDEKVATIIADESGTIVIEEDEKEDYISNTKSTSFEHYLELLEKQHLQDESKSGEERG